MAKEILVFTDGSSRGNPGPGGWGAIIATDTDVIELGGRDERTTNNRMELLAASAALHEVRARGQRTPVIVFSDSSYLVNGMERWVAGWKQNGWKTKEKGEVLNRDLWESLDDAAASLSVSWRRVAGHAGHDANERCDRIATTFADNQPITLYRGSRAGYRILINTPKGAHASSHGVGRAGKAYSYVSMVDGIITTHDTWTACERRVKGAKGARYRKALSAEDEKAIFAEFKGM